MAEALSLSLSIGIRNEVGRDGQLVPPRRGDYLEQPIRLLGDDGQRLLLARESIAQPREVRRLMPQYAGGSSSVLRRGF